MKFLLSAVLLTSFSAFAGQGYSSNDGKNAPGNFSTKSTEVSEVIQKEEVAPAATSETGIKNPTGITTDEMNSSPNPVPSSDQEVIDNTTLSKGQNKETGPFTKKTEYKMKKEVQSQEESPMDYSTTPEKTDITE